MYSLTGTAKDKRYSLDSVLQDLVYNLKPSRCSRLIYSSGDGTDAVREQDKRGLRCQLNAYIYGGKVQFLRISASVGMQLVVMRTLTVIVVNQYITSDISQ